MMTREEAIAELSVLYERLSNPKDCEDGCYSWEDGRYVEAVDIAIKTLEQTRWIPCSERLPKIEENPVLVTSMGLVGMGWYRNGDWLTSTNLPFFDVVAWMPLPEPYRKDEA